MTAGDTLGNAEGVSRGAREMNAHDGADAALRQYWDADAPTYDSWPEHVTRGAVEQAAWSSELGRLLPPAPARVLDVGAGTGFLSLAVARLGHRVTSLDVSARMLEHLAASARAEGLEIETVCAPGDQPPSGPFDAVVERLALWSLPNPAAALGAWRRATAPGGTLVVIESVWTGGSLGDALRRRARKWLHRRLPPEHHDSYPPDLVAELPLMREPFANRYLEEIAAAGWRNLKLTRLRDVEFARVISMTRLEQLGGTNPHYAITAEAGFGPPGEPG